LPPAQPDFSVIERTWESRLRQRGLSPSRVGDSIATGLDALEIRRQETQCAEFDTDATGNGFIASVEVRAWVEAPDLGAHEIHDLVTQRGPSLEGALEACANTFMDVTFPPLETLFTGRRPTGPGTGKVTLTSYTPRLGRGYAWDVILGPLQVLDDEGGAVRERLREKPPLTLALDNLIGHLAEPRLHWCKLVGGTNHPNPGLTFGCSVSGQKDRHAEAEMAEKFGEPIPGPWQFRQFLVIRPTGEADPETTAELKARAAEAFGPEEPAPPERRRGWWSRWFGG
jgi:hypothetical protein